MAQETAVAVAKAQYRVRPEWLTFATNFEQTFV